MRESLFVIQSIKGFEYALYSQVDVLRQQNHDSCDILGTMKQKVLEQLCLHILPYNYNMGRSLTVLKPRASTAISASLNVVSVMCCSF
jgi:hypothetical protein